MQDTAYAGVFVAGIAWTIFASTWDRQKADGMRPMTADERAVHELCRIVVWRSIGRNPYAPLEGGAR